MSKSKIAVIWLVVALALCVAGCKKKAPPPPPPPPPPPVVEAKPAPPSAPIIAQFSAEPTTIQRGQSSTLRWEVSGQATTVSINQSIGTVQNAGSRLVFPSETTQYALTATGPGGTVTQNASVSVTAPPPPPPPPADTRPRQTLDKAIESMVQDAYFDYDKSDIRSDASEVLTRNAAAIKNILADFPGSSIIVEGHCDERGSAEYNLGLGDRRASSAKDFLVQLGVPADRLRTISYGKERPQCTSSDESCWQRNRRAHFAPGQ